MSIKLSFHTTDDDLTGQSKWWGFPDMPDNLDYPEITVNDDGDQYEDPLTFICQIRCEDIVPFDTENLLPHEGMLYFFAAMDYYLGDIDTLAYPGMGDWETPYYKVLYSPTCENLHTHKILYDDGTPACRPTEAISFEKAEPCDDDTKLLGFPYFDEIREQFPDYISLLQIDENDEWNLRFIDCGMLCFLMTSDDLKNRHWNQVKCYLHSF